MTWYSKDISRDTALEFFDQSYEFTESIVKSLMPEISHVWPLSNKMFIKDFDFEPEGAIIHVSESPSLYNTMLLHSKNVYSSHAIILNSNRFTVPKVYPLLKTMPATVLCPYKIHDILPHSGYISSVSWGIELRNCGILRPYKKNGVPPPITRIEETDNHFRNKDDKVDHYWKLDLWRNKYNDNNVYVFDDYHFERPSFDQIKTLIIVLRSMNSIHELYRDMIVPSNCITGKLPVLPIIPWKELRQIALSGENITKGCEPEWINAIFNKGVSNLESEQLEYFDEGILIDQLSNMKWRSEYDDGQLDMLYEMNSYTKSYMFRRILQSIGFSTENKDEINFSMKMYAISKKLGLANEQDVHSKFLKEIQENKIITSRN